ncbi:MAG TPA: hypothetical protein VMB51_05670 [Solirubrobacteraceae bacterium]|nr:hypothetical protein [Solirubrobacteraceae bacterium]
MTVRFTSDREAGRIFSRLRSHVAAARAVADLKHLAFARREGAWLRVYAASYDGLRRSQQVVADVIQAEGVSAEETAQHLDAGADSWQPISLPPLAERDERLVVEHRGAAPWGSEAEPDRIQVRFEMPNRDAAVDFADVLTDAGYVVHRCDSFLFLFADDSESAHALADKLLPKAPDGAKMYFMGEGPLTVFI